MSSRALSWATSVEHFVGGDGVGRGDEVAGKTEFGAGLHLVADVDLGGGHVAHEHGGEAGPHAAWGECAHFFGDFLLDGCGDGRAIENLRHSWLQRFMVSPRAGQPALNRRGSCNMRPVCRLNIRRCWIAGRHIGL